MQSNVLNDLAKAKRRRTEKNCSTAGTSLPYSAPPSKDLEMFLSTNGRSENGGQGGEVPGGNVNFASLLLLFTVAQLFTFFGP